MPSLAVAPTKDQLIIDWTLGARLPRVLCVISTEVLNGDSLQYPKNGHHGGKAPSSSPLRPRDPTVLTCSPGPSSALSSRPARAPERSCLKQQYQK